MQASSCPKSCSYFWRRTSVNKWNSLIFICFEWKYKHRQMNISQCKCNTFLSEFIFHPYLWQDIKQILSSSSFSVQIYLQWRKFGYWIILCVHNGIWKWNTEGTPDMLKKNIYVCVVLQSWKHSCRNQYNSI